MKPLIKWVGGKSWFIKHAAVGINKYLEETGGAYVEPFVGGGAMAFWLGRYSVLNDNNRRLINMYRHVRDYPDAVAMGLSSLLVQKPSKKRYYEVRKALNEENENSIENSCRFIYLNRLCYRGVYRENSKGEFNVPWGDYKTFAFPSNEDLRQYSKVLSQCKLRYGDFYHIIDEVDEDDFLYIDPPYDGTYTGYSAGGFTKTDQVDLAEYVLDSGCHFVMHNADTPLIRKLYRGEHIVPVDEKQSINTNKAPCVVITTKPDLLML